MLFIVSTVFALLLHNCKGQDNVGCPLGFQPFNERCFMMSTKELSWGDAMKACSQEGGNLATVDSEDIQIYLSGYAEFTNKHSSVGIATANDYKYHYLHDLGIDIHGRTSMVFSVQTCHDAHIALSSQKGLDTTDTYEIVIGGWSDSQSVIRDCKQCAHKDEVHHTSHPVSCTDFHPFWISWSDNVIRVGHGNDVGESQFMAWNDTDPHAVLFAAVATGFGAHGNWTFPVDTFMPGKFWVGATNAVPEGEWIWLPSRDAMTQFTNWASNEPNNMGGNQHCLVMDFHSQMQWKDEDCGERRNYICEAPVTENIIIG